jgi:hypothetical protein
VQGSHVHSVLDEVCRKVHPFRAQGVWSYDGVYSGGRGRHRESRELEQNRGLHWVSEVPGHCLHTEAMSTEVLKRSCPPEN